MKRKIDWLKCFTKSMSYVLVALVASAVTFALSRPQYSKLVELETLINTKFIGSFDGEAVQDAAARAMVDSLSDRWSYYLTQEEYTAQKQSVNNTYVGVGITVAQREDGTGLDILEVMSGSSAWEKGVLPGDILVEAQDQSVAGWNPGQVKSLIGGQDGKQVSITVLRGEERKVFLLECREVKVAVASGRLLNNNVGLVRVENFHTDCGKEVIAVIEDLQEQGASALIFDVRNNPGGYVREMLKVLDYLLPEGVLFREEDYEGNQFAEHSDSSCVELPMAVLVNGDSYSAAEFFAACLQEYDYATVVGEQTCGKGYYQNTIPLSDGTAVNLSIGKYFTPNGVSLTETGGVTPDVIASVDEETAEKIYAQTIADTEDPQLQAAVQAVGKTQG